MRAAFGHWFDENLQALKMSLSPIIDDRYRLKPADIGRAILRVTIRNVSLQGVETLCPVLHLGESSINCKQDMILAHERLGAYLSTVIPPDSLVYWDGGNAYTPMI